MSALFMSHHRFSTINPEDIARFGGRRPSLNSIAFRSETDSESESDDEEAGSSKYEPVVTYDADAEEKAIGQGTRTLKRHGSTRRSGRFWRRHPILGPIYRNLKRAYRKFGLSHVLPILLLIAYSFLGAIIFQAIEMPYAEQKRKGDLEKLENNRRMAMTVIVSDLRLPNNIRVENQLLNILIQFERNNSIPVKETITWDLWGSLFYCGTIFTTVGYGNIYPQTSVGWVVTMVYAFFGVPLLLAILSDIGQLLCFWMDHAWRKVKESFSRTSARGKGGSDSSIDPLVEVFGESGAPQPGVPVILALAITFSWLLMCSAMFCLWETDWSYFTAFYFCFISFTTIGLGDIIPNEPMLMVLNSGFLIVGLCLVSMTIGVVQEHIELFLYRVMMALQKECEQLLSSGEDVDKQELVNKIWDQQPWYVKRFMPALMGDAGSKRLDDFAGATITDTAVQMGIIPSPPGYHRTTPFTKAPYQPTAAPPNRNSEPHHEPNANPFVVKQPGALSTAIVKASTDLVKPLVPKVAKVRPQMRVSDHAELLPGGRAIVRRTKSTSSADFKLQQALRWRTVMTQTQTASTANAFVQTDLTAPEMKKETLSTISVASWSETDDFPVGRPLLPLLSVSEFEEGDKELYTSTAQTDLTAKEVVLKMDTLSNMSLASWKEDDDNSGPLSPVSMHAFAVQELFHFGDVGQEKVKVSSYGEPMNVAVQTDPIVWITHDDVSDSSEDFQSVESASRRTAERDVDEQMTNVKNIETQTSSSQLDAAVQCKVLGFQANKAVQTIPKIELIYNALQKTQDTKITPKKVFDRGTQCESRRCERATQTADVEIKNSQTQTESTEISDVGTRTSGEKGENEQKKDEIKTDQKPAQVTWSHKTWYNDHRGQFLDIVPEEENESEEEESSEDEELDEDESDLADEEEPVRTLPEKSVQRESPQSKPDLVDTETQTDEYISRISIKGEVELRSALCQTPKLKEKPKSTKDVMTAAFATQTEDFLERRGTFPKLDAEALITSRHHGGTFKEKWSAWKGRRHARRHSQDKSNVAIQTDGYVGDGVRDIVCQTDDSYLRIATKLNTLRHNRAKSLKVTAVGPKTKQRVNRYAASATEKK